MLLLTLHVTVDTTYYAVTSLKKQGINVQNVCGK